MSAELTGHLLRRGHEAYTYVKEKKVKIDLPAWAIVILATTGIAFVVIMFMIQYTYGRVIPTLLMIESPQENIGFEPIPTEDNDDNINKNPEEARAKPQYITSSFRRSVQLLQSLGGFRARFRGVAIFFVHNILVQWISGMLSAAAPTRFFLRGLANIIASVAVAQLALGWTLIVISEPSPKSWFRRIPTIKTWKKIAGPTALCAFAEQIAVMIPLELAVCLGLNKDPKEVGNLPEHVQKAIVAKSLGIFVLGLVLGVLLVLPANVILTRIQASLISEAEETIVPFDRTFGGKVMPEIVGGSGRIGILDAWTTFDWSARVRLIKAYLKVFAMQMGVSLVFTIIFVCEFLAIGGVHKIIIPDDGKN